MLIKSMVKPAVTKLWCVLSILLKPSALSTTQTAAIMFNHDSILSLASILSQIYPDRPGPENYVKYNDPVLTDATIDAGIKRDEYFEERTCGRSLFVKLWSPLSKRFLEEWKDIKYDLDSMFQTYKEYKMDNRAVNSQQDSGVPYDIDDILGISRTFKVVLVSDAEEEIMNDPARLWQLTDRTYEGDFKTETVFKIPRYFDVILGLRLPWSHPSDKVTLSIYIAAYHAFDIEVNKREPTLMVDGRYPLLFPRYHDAVIVGMEKDEFLILFGSIFCDDDVRSCLFEQGLIYHLSDEHQLAEAGGMAFKVAARSDIESQLITDKTN